MKNFFHVLKNEYINIFHDAGTLLIFFGAFIIYPLFYPSPYANEVLKNVPVAVVDMNHSQLSHKLTRMIDANQSIRITANLPALNQAKVLLKKGDISGIIFIPDNFETLILQGNQTSISVYSDASLFLKYKQVLSGIYQSAGTLSAQIEIKRMLYHGVMMEQACSLRDPLSLISIPMFNPMGGYASYLIPAVFILLLQQTLLVGIGLLSGTEKENKTNENSKYQDLSIISIISGKACAYFSIYMIHIAYLFGILFKFYHFPLNATPLSLILFLIPYLFACIFLGQAISYFFKTREMSMVILLFSSMPAIFLSGFAWPKFSMPAWLNHIAILLPSTCGIEGFLKISQTGASLKDIGYDWMVLIILTIIYFILAVIAMKNQYRTTSNSQSTI